MKAHVKVVELDGTADEIAKVIGGVTAPTIIEHSAPVTPFEPVPEAAPALERSVRAKATKPREELVSDLTDALYDAAGVAAGEMLDGGPFESPHDIPAEWRLLNGSGMTCHIRTQPGVAVAMCPASRKQIGARRIHDSEVPFKNTEVCSACNTALAHSRRKDA